MIVATRLAPRMMAHVSYVARDGHRVIAAESWGELLAAVHVQPVDVAVVDVAADTATAHERTSRERPSTAGDGVTSLAEVMAGAEAVRTIRALRQAAVPVLVYTTVTADTARHLADLVECGVQHYVFRGVDDQPGCFRERLDALSRSGLEDRLVLPILEALARRGASSLVVAVVRQLFRAPERFRVASDLAAVAGCTRWYFSDTLRRAGLAPGRTLILAARLLRAYHCGHGTGATATAAALRLRYASAEKFRRHVYQFTGGSFAAWCQQTPEQCVMAIRARVSVTGGQSPPAETDESRPVRLQLAG